MVINSIAENSGRWLKRNYQSTNWDLTGAFSERVRHLITSEDVLIVAMVSVYCIMTLHMSNSLIFCKGGLILGYAPYIGAIN